MEAYYQKICVCTMFPYIKTVPFNQNCWSSKSVNWSGGGGVEDPIY